MTWSGFAVSDAAIPQKTETLCNSPCVMQGSRLHVCPLYKNTSEHRPGS